MTFKLSHVALAFVASASLCAAAETLVPSSKVSADANIIVSQDAKLTLAITPVANLTVSDVKKGKTTTVAKFKVGGSTGDNTAVRLRASEPHNPTCADLRGVSNNHNKMQVCLDSPPEKLVDDGVTYYKYGNGEFAVVSSPANTNPAMPVGIDTYNMAMELVRYTK